MSLNKFPKNERQCLTMASHIVYRSFPGRTICKHASVKWRWTHQTARTWQRHSQRIYADKTDLSKHGNRMVQATPATTVAEVTCAIVHSQRRFRPSNRYWSAALSTSCAMSKLISTDPVYMYLQRTKWTRFRIEVSMVMRVVMGVLSILPHHQLKNFPSDVRNLYVLSISLLQRISTDFV